MRVKPDHLTAALFWCTTALVRPVSFASTLSVFLCRLFPMNDTVLTPPRGLASDQPVAHVSALQSENARALRWSRLWSWLFAALVTAIAGVALMRYRLAMDPYEQAILCLGACALLWLVSQWGALRYLALLAGMVAAWALQLYDGDIGRADSVFMLKYFLSSQTAVFWMSLCFFFATAFYWVGLWQQRQLTQTAAAPGEQGSLLRVASGMVWLAVGFALVALLVRWYESHLITPGGGHIPVSNLYEVLVLFSWVTALFYLYYEQHYRTRSMGAFVLPLVCAAVLFLLWYSITRDAHTIRPLVPALQSWWMKLHVPANFVGYGTFAVAAMLGLAYLYRMHFPSHRLAQSLPSLVVLDDVMYKAIAVGFAFFTVATVLGAYWAAEAWGRYWSWDPKETWALIVWLNYAAWLHLRLVGGLRARFAAWWAVVGLFITLFAFLGVNMFLSGLHSYGTL